MPQQKKWVFNELVKDPDNLQELLSYVVYKKSKDEIARNARASGKDEDEIEKELKAYHDQCVHTLQLLEMFREKATRILDGYLTDVSTQLKTSLTAELSKLEEEKNKQIRELERKLKDSEKIALKKFSEGSKIYASKINVPKKWEWDWWKTLGWNFVKFLFSGLPKFVATTVSMAILVAVVTFANGDANNIVRAGLTKLVDLVAPAKPYKEESNQPNNNQQTLTKSTD